MRGNYANAMSSGLYITIILRAATVRNWNVLFIYLCKAIEIHKVTHSSCPTYKSNRHKISHKSIKSHFSFITLTKGLEEHAIVPSG